MDSHLYDVTLSAALEFPQSEVTMSVYQLSWFWPVSTMVMFHRTKRVSLNLPSVWAYVSCFYPQYMGVYMCVECVYVYSCWCCQFTDVLNMRSTRCQIILQVALWACEFHVYVYLSIVIRFGIMVCHCQINSMSPFFQELNVILQKWLDGLSCLPVDMEEYPHNQHSLLILYCCWHSRDSWTDQYFYIFAIPFQSLWLSRI